MRSHITIPKSTLKRFSEMDENGQNVASYYDKTEKIIKTVGANDNRKRGYFSSIFENYLSDKVETVLGEINKEIVKIDNNEEVSFDATLKKKKPLLAQWSCSQPKSHHSSKIIF